MSKKASKKAAKKAAHKEQKKERKSQALSTGERQPSYPAPLVNLEGVGKLTKDLRAATATMSAGEVRFLVDYYYMTQEDRKRAAGQVRAMVASGEPHQTLVWLFNQSAALEDEVRKALGHYAKSTEVGRWCLSITGIGPVMTAGLLAHIDVTKAPTCGHIWRYAGLDPTSTWNKGEKRPWNAQLKRLCWLIGQSFIKTHNNDKDVYGHLLMERREYEQRRNEAGELAEQAAAKLQKFKIGKDTEAYGHYSAGRLPPAHILARAQRYATKLFLSHLHEKMYVTHFGKQPPLPYPIAFQSHTHKIEMPDTEAMSASQGM